MNLNKKLALKKVALGGKLLVVAQTSMAGGKSTVGTSRLVLDELPVENSSVCYTPKASINDAQLVPDTINIAIPTGTPSAKISFTVSGMSSSDKQKFLFLVYSTTPITGISPVKSVISDYQFGIPLEKLSVLGFYDIPAIRNQMQVASSIGKASGNIKSKLVFDIALDPQKIATASSSSSTGSMQIYVQAGLINQDEFNAGDFSNLLLSEVDNLNLSLGSCSTELTSITTNSTGKTTTTPGTTSSLTKTGGGKTINNTQNTGSTGTSGKSGKTSTSQVPSSVQPTPITTPTNPTTPATPTTAFKVVGRFLQDSTGNNINLRGVNVPIFKSGWLDDLQNVSLAVNNSGANSVRLEWWSNPKNNEPYYKDINNLDRAITQYVNMGMLPIVELHDTTCYLAIPQNQCNDKALFKTLSTDFWTRADVIALVKKHQNHLIVNLGNEWGTTYNGAADEAAYVQNYVAAITSIRNAWSASGVGNIPLMVDAPNGGSGGKVFITNGNGQTILNADPLKNTLLSVHTYWPDTDGYTAASITSLLSDLQNSNLPIVLGEVGTTANGSQCGQDNVDWNTILTQAANRNISTLAWSWYEEGNCNDMNIAPDGITLPANDGALTFRNQVLRNNSYGLNKAVRFNIPQ